MLEGAATDLNEADKSGRPEPIVTTISWIAIGILLMMTILSYIDRNIMSLMVDPIKADLGLDDIQMSLLLGFAFALFYALFSVPMGWAADRFPRRWVIFLGVGGWSLATAACGFAGSFGQLAVARFAVGIGEAALTPAAYAIVGELFPRRRLGLALGILAMGTAAGSAIAFLIGGPIIAWVDHVGGISGFATWQVVFMLVGLPGLLIAPLIFIVPEKRRAHVSTHAQVDQGFFPWIGQNWAFVVPFFTAISFAGIISYALGAWLPAYLTRTMGVDVSKVGLTIGSIQLLGIVGFVAGGWFVDWMVSRGVRDAHLRYLIGALALAGISGLGAFLFADTLNALLVWLALFYLTIPFTGPAIALVQIVAPRRFHSRTIAIYTLAINMVGMMAGPSSVALFTEKVFGGPQHVGAGLTTVFAVSVPLALLCFILSIPAARRMTERQALAGD
ncbi:MFS transporter [Sphingomonas montanisoli]|uniref:MFS transporter n=1 Tax=Sphingomonas montanisoli TaxID=2606412 RepID=A0A5D9C7J6_9SPHN|nr:MFS transporter [Sphingomonas montanisoli]TZG26025.1 MFS transporter [Sphingomonas montanisoli]